jgi:hypothetical protein
MAVRLSAFRSGRPAALYLPGRYLIHISTRSCVDPMIIVQLEGLSKLKTPVTSMEIEPATFRLRAYATAFSLFIEISLRENHLIL